VIEIIQLNPVLLAQTFEFGPSAMALGAFYKCKPVNKIFYLALPCEMMDKSSG
jgi:hypothetical protein